VRTGTGSVRSMASGKADSDNMETPPSNLGLSLNLFEHDALIWAGDMNMRLWEDEKMKVTLDRKQTFAALEDYGEHKEFMDVHDEMSIQKAKGLIFGDFEEAPITFMPTYKMKEIPLAQEKNQVETPAPHRSNEIYFYVTKRQPAFTDRVLWRAKGSMAISRHVYERLSRITASDHRPVRLGLVVEARDVRWDKLQEICQEQVGNRTKSVDLKPRRDSMSGFSVLEGQDYLRSTSGRCGYDSVCCIL